MTLPGLHDVYLARKVLQGRLTPTTLLYSASLSRRLKSDVWLKLENQQPIGAFKLRGATYALHCLAPTCAQKGVVTCSTGNHGRAIAYAGRQLGIRTVVCMSSLVPDNKVEAIKALGAQVHIFGSSQDEAETYALQLVEHEGMTYIPPFDHPHIIAGQGTIALEIIEELPDVDLIMAGLSGGGLLGGIGLVAKHINPAIQVWGASMQSGAAMICSLEAGHPVQVTETPSFADSLGGGVGLNNQYTFNLIQRHLDRYWRVSETAIAAEMLWFLEQEKMLLEGAAVASIAALEEHQVDVTGRRIVFVISGQNVALQRFDEARHMSIKEQSNAGVFERAD